MEERISALEEAVRFLRVEITRLRPKTESSNADLWLYGDPRLVNSDFPEENECRVFYPRVEDEDAEARAERYAFGTGVVPYGTDVAGTLYLGGAGAPYAWREQLAIPTCVGHAIPFVMPCAPPYTPSASALALGREARTRAAAVLVVLVSGHRNYRAYAELCHAIGSGHPRVYVVWPDDLSAEAYAADDEADMLLGSAGRHSERDVQIAALTFVKTLVQQYMDAHATRTHVKFASVADFCAYATRHVNTLGRPVAHYMYSDEAVCEAWLAGALRAQKETATGDIDVLHVLRAAYEQSIATGDRSGIEGRRRAVTDAVARIKQLCDERATSILAAINTLV